MRSGKFLFDNRRLLSMHFNKHILHFISILGLAFVGLMSSCGGDKIDIPDTPLEGLVAGEEWTFKMGGYRVFFPNDHTYSFHSMEESGNDPCALVSTSTPYLTVVIPAAQASTSLPLLDPLRNFQFNDGSGKVLGATSGFIEIFARDPLTGRIFGYLQAIFDEDNTVEGRFEVEPC